MGIKMAYWWRILDMRIEEKGTRFHESDFCLIYILWLYAVAPARGDYFRQDRLWDSAKFVERYVAGGLLLMLAK